MPAIGTSPFLIAPGAILRYVATTASWPSPRTDGLILMIVAAAGLAITATLTALHLRDSPSKRSLDVTGDGRFYR